MGKKLKKVVGSLKCPYCQKPAKFEQGKTRNRWVCHPCRAWVYTPKTSNKPHGTWANGRLRQLRREAQFCIDYLCETKAIKHQVPVKQARQAGYAWLAKKVGIKFEKFEIRSLDDRCQRALDACKPIVLEIKKKKAIAHRHAQKRAKALAVEA